jgi:LysR family transcriptional regulator of beta-lactamase
VVFDSSLAMAEAAAQGAGVALLPTAMFTRELRSGRLVKVFATEIDAGGYWLTRLRSRRETAAMRAFRDWLLRAANPDGGST